MQKIISGRIYKPLLSVVASVASDRCRGRDPLHGMAFCILDSVARLVRRR